VHTPDERILTSLTCTTLDWTLQLYRASTSKLATGSSLDVWKSYNLLSKLANQDLTHLNARFEILDIEVLVRSMDLTIWESQP